LLEGGRGILDYVPGPERSHVFEVTEKDVLCVELSRRSLLERARRAWVGELAIPPQAEAGAPEPAALARVHGLGRTLASLVLPAESWARVSRWSELLVVGLDLIGYLPFEALPAPDGELLGLELPISYLPSFAVASELRRRAGAELPWAPAHGKKELALIASPVPTEAVLERWPELRPLPWRDSSARGVRSVYGPENVGTFSGSSATAKALGRAREQGARVLQVLTHGVYDSRRERPAGIVLSSASPQDSDDKGDMGVLWADEIEQMRVPELVLLWVCGAGRGPLRRGDDGVSNLAGAFLRSGASTVILSPVDLDYEACLKLSDAFHRHLAGEGDSPAHALFEARRELAREPAFAHPFYHSLVHAVGLASEPRLEPRRGSDAGRTRVIVVALFVIVLVALGALVLARRARAHAENR